MMSNVQVYDGVAQECEGAYRMEAKEAFRLRRETFGKPCIHGAVEKEYANGLDTGIWVCPKCGTEFGSRNVWAKILRNQQQEVTL